MGGGPRRRSGAMEGGPRRSGATEGACNADARNSRSPTTSGPMVTPMNERVLGAGELDEEGPFPLAARIRPRLTCDIEAITRGRQVVGIHPAGGEPARRVRETSCCVGSDPI